jgi:hypothetical protein
LPEIVEVVAANAAAANSSVKQPTTPESQQQIAALLPTIQTMFARNKVSRSGSRTRTADASHAPFVDPAVCTSALSPAYCVCDSNVIK